MKEFRTTTRFQHTHLHRNNPKRDTCEEQMHSYGSFSYFQASLKEAELRLEEIRRAKNVFERRLHAHMKDHRLEKKEPEKLLQYFEDKSKVTQRFRAAAKFLHFPRLRCQIQLVLLRGLFVHTVCSVQTHTLK